MISLTLMSLYSSSTGPAGVGGRLNTPLGLAAPDVGPRAGSLRIISLPNFWAHANCDYAMTTRLLPVGPGLTDVEVCFLVRGDAVEGVDYDPERVAAVWRATSEQDWELCENNAAGIRSVAYEPGPFSPVTESSVEGFLRWYLDELSGRNPGPRSPRRIPAGAWREG